MPNKDPIPTNLRHAFLKADEADEAGMEASWQAAIDSGYEVKQKTRKHLLFRLQRARRDLAMGKVQTPRVRC